MPLARANVASVNFVITSRRAMPPLRTWDIQLSLQNGEALSRHVVAQVEK
jgi:hypothetical protein